MVQESLLTPSVDHPSIADEQNPVMPDKEPKIWQLHNKYIICQIKTGVMIIDQHVAHERVLYERAVDVMNEAAPNSQQLLFPQKIDLKPWQYEVFEEISDELYRLGFNIRPFGGMSVMIEGVPPDVRDGTEATILQDMIAEYQENASRLKLEKRDNLAKSYSCRNAIMTGQKLGVEEMRGLIDRLFATRMPYVCPHGRPVIIRLSLDELDRMFGRK
jgi:DNA mismatch repair protein MutL